MSNYRERAENLCREAHAIAELPIFQKAEAAQRIALDSAHLLRDVCGEIDRLKGGGDAK